MERKIEETDYDLITIEAQLFNLGKIFDNPLILLIGRGQVSTFECKLFETEKFSNFKVLKLDISELTVPDIVSDFNKHDDRINVGNIIRSMRFNLVLVQFDYSVLKYMGQLPLLFRDVHDILVAGGIFIFPYEVQGGCIVIQKDSIPSITDLNCISIPFSFLEESTKGVDQFSQVIKDDIIIQSQYDVLAKLGEIFKFAEMHYEKCYPFFYGITCTYYVCTTSNVTPINNCGQFTSFK